MPKDELDPDDPMELCGVGLLTPEDTTETMAECFIEEFLRLGHDPVHILALFRNRHYTGMHMVLEHRGEAFVKAKISEVCGWWGREVPWSTAGEAAPRSNPAYHEPVSAAPAPGTPTPAFTRPPGESAEGHHEGPKPAAN